MTTELKRFQEAYATMTIAVYEPLIIRWISKMGLWLMADTYAARAMVQEKPTQRSAIHDLVQERSATLPANPESILRKSGVNFSKLRQTGQSLSWDELHTQLRGNGGLQRLMNMEVTPDTIYPTGRTRVVFDGEFGHLVDGQKNPEMYRAAGVSFQGATIEYGSKPGYWTEPIPVFPGGGQIQLSPRYLEVRTNLSKDFFKTAKKFADERHPASELRELLLEDVKKTLGDIDHHEIADFLPVGSAYTIMEALSPIGVAHFYRQLYYYAYEGVGPIEQAFTVAPLETLEVVYENVHRQTHEELVEMGSETISENAIESKNMDEVSDKVSAMIQRDTSAGMSANANFTASGSIGVWQAGASASVGANSTISSSNKRSTEMASHKLKETTKRASERITKSFSLKVRNVDEITTTNITRRIIKNDSAAPVSFGLRRVFSRIKVKVQDMGPALVWQLYIREPGAGLAQSKFVHYLESQPISRPLDPPAIPPRPIGGTDTGSTSAALKWDSGRNTYYVSIVVQTGPDRMVTAVSIDSITDLEGGGKEDLAPSAKNDVNWGGTWNASTHSFTVNIGILPGDAASVSVNYTYNYDAGGTAMQDWEKQRDAAIVKFQQAEADARQKALQEQFDRDKTLITEKRKIKSRPAVDLRREERYEVMNRMVSHLFGRKPNPSTPSPLEIEYFHRYFDIESMFIYTHPSWWKPRYSRTTTGLNRPPYEITAESEPAAMGSSLGWVLQLDGDTRRNEFLNSPWVRVCMPMRPGREREAIGWLAKHIEGEIGYDPGQEPLKTILQEIETIHQNQDALGLDGPDYVTVSSTVGAPAGPLKPENVYPVVDEFEVTVPTEGFVYDDLKIIIP